MKKSRFGFTLIELLAVIVVIVVILAITVPIVSNIIETVRKEAFKATAYSISDSGRFLMANEGNSLGYQEFYYRDGLQYNADSIKLDYTGDGPKTGVVVLNERNKVVLAIHNGTYCATKSADTNKVTITDSAPDDCIANNIINTCDTWEQIALKYDINIESLLEINNVTDPNEPTCGLNIKIPYSSTSTSTNYASDGQSVIYYKTYYSVGYTTYSESFTSTSYTYTIELGVLPLNISNIETVRVTTQSVFENLDDFKRYINKKNLGEVIWPGEINPPEINIEEASTFKDHALRNVNMNADDVSIECDETNCYASITTTVNNMNNVSPNTINGTPIAYIPVKFTVEFNGQAEACTVRTTTDVVPGTLAGTGVSTDPYLIESIEDLVALSNNVKSGNTYSGKYLSFTNSFDFTNKRSYKDYSTTTFGDINGNGLTEELLTELTTGAGFVPIGNNTYQFNGNVSGNSNCIFDLYINRPTIAYVGLFGFYTSNTITNLTLTDINITGGDYTGGLIGYNYGSNVFEGSITGNVTGKNYVGLVSGYIDRGTTASFIVEGNVTGVDHVGGITGRGNRTGGIRGLNKGGNIIATGVNYGRLIGSAYNGLENGLALSSVTLNGNTATALYTPGSDYGFNGITIDSIDSINNINLANYGLDTYINGDDDGNGYYWDYDERGALVKKSIVDNPLTFSLTGAGTTADPYIINTYEDLKQATLKLTSVFKMNSDIDLSGKKFYMLGNLINPFRGTFDGNNKTISNLTLNVPKAYRVGFSGQNEGVITSLNLTNANVSSGDYTGGLVGVNYGHARDCNVTGDVVGGTYVGLITGYTESGTIISATVEGNVTGSNYVGGLTGKGHRTGGVRGINKGANIVSTGSSYGRIMGGSYYGAENGLALSNVTLNGVTTSALYTPGSDNAFNGITINTMEEALNNINLANYGLDTYINGDDDGNGYYWDYDNSGAIVRKSVTSDPLTFSLAGSGTTTDPYLISNYTDLKQATLRLSSHYRIISDIDLSGERFYMLGSYINPFRGSIDGNSKTISNANVDTMRGSYIGFSGYNRGVIRDLNLTNVDISGANFVGGLVGYIADGQVFNSNITGDVMGTDYVGLITGYFYASGTHQITSVTTQGNVIGVNNVGGMVGFAYYAGVPTDSVCAVRGINKGGMIIATGGSIGRIVGGYGREYAARPYVAISALALSSVTINGSTIASTSPTSTQGANITSMNDLNNINLAETALDTYIGGDNDGDGYYWDYDASYNVVRKKTSEYPLTFNLIGSGTTADPYLIGSYDELKQASLKLGSAYRLTTNIDMTDKKYYMIGSQVNNFTGRFDGNAMTISNLTLNNPYGSYVGLIGYNRGTIMGINLTNIDIDASDFVVGIAGYSVNSQITNSKITGNVSGNNYVALVTGYFYTSGVNEISSVIVEGNVSGNSRVAGVAGHLQNGNGALEVAGAVKTIYTGGSITGTSSLGRIAASYGRDYAARPYITINSSAVSSIPLNGATVTSTTSSSIHGLDITAADLSNTVTYTDRGFNFTDETLDYIWYIDNGTATFRAGSM